MKFFSYPRQLHLTVLILCTIGLCAISLYAFPDDVKQRIYAHPLEPREHPDYSRRAVKPPDWRVFGNQTRFTSIRGFAVENDMIVNYEKDLDQYTKTYQLGEVIWPAYPILFAKNLGDLADEIKRRDLYLFDIWGFVPGSGPGGYWQQYKPPEGVFDLLEAKLGERWLGADVGEQDGRYIGGYASQMSPASADRFHQYLNFQRHFQRMCDDLGNKMSTLVSLNFGHYFLKEGVYAAIGAETAQGLPNGQVYYSFIRGAGKQYGVPWFGNASVFNRWGYKSYGGDGPDHSPTKGTSLSLFKRLMYSHILYNSVFVGFESGWFDAKGELSPIGKIQEAAGRWVRENGRPGDMITPFALMVDFYSGWSFPRHLYSGDVYRVWGNLPYTEGDYLTDGVLDMFYPGYQNSSYFHDESGFQTATPYGDSVDCLLSDAPPWLLKRYAVLAIAGELSGGLEVRDKLLDYAASGGHLVITAGNLAKFPEGLMGIRAEGEPHVYQTGDSVLVGDRICEEANAYALYPLRFPAQAKILARCGDQPAAVEIACGSGRITVLASPFGLCAQPMVREEIRSEEDKSLAKPYPLVSHVRVLLNQIFRSPMLFDLGNDLGWIVCRKNPGEYMIGVCNNNWKEHPLKIESLCGPIESIREIPLDQSEKDAIGYLPEVVKKDNLGVSGGGTIAGGDIRIFDVKAQEKTVKVIPHLAPPARPNGRILPLRDIHSIKEAVLARPTFFEHYDGIAIDWKYLHEREEDALRSERGWISRQGLRVVVDLTTGVNLYPDLRLLDNDAQEYDSSKRAIENVLAKMEILHASDLLIALHRTPENNFTDEQSWSSFEKNLREIANLAEARDITVNLRLAPNKPPWSLKQAIDFLNRIGTPNLRLAPSTALLLSHEGELGGVGEELKNRVGFWLVSTTESDIAGRIWNWNAPTAGSGKTGAIQKIIAFALGAPLLFDVPYSTQDEEYLDAKELQ